jgi:hypothetical protein
LRLSMFLLLLLLLLQPKLRLQLLPVSDGFYP